MKIKARRTKELKDAYFIKAGVSSEYKEFEIDPMACTPEQRALLLEWESGYRETPCLEREDEDVFDLISRVLREQKIEEARKEARSAARAELQPVIDNLRAEIKSLKAEIKSLQGVEKEELTKEEKFLINEGFKPFSYVADRHLEDEVYEHVFPYENRLGLPTECWIDVDNKNKEVFVLEVNDRYWTK